VALPRVRSSFSAPILLVWADEHDRPDAAEGRLRQVYAELGGMIGGSHKSERPMLSTRSAGMATQVAMVDMLELRLRSTYGIGRNTQSAAGSPGLARAATKNRSSSGTNSAVRAPDIVGMWAERP